MTELLEQAIDRIRTLPRATQDAFAKLLMQLAGESGVYHLNAEEEADLAAADDEIAREDFASEARVRAVFAKYGA